ncbi:MAG TPA: DUF6265 family protein [Allosphingosinicella sp.]|nr:DUF6265 family protein [Allosphingosinicella sp.]
MMKRMAIAISAWAMLAAAAPAGQSVEALAWLSGVWVQEKQGRWTEERWAPPRGGVMLGTSLSGSGAVAREFEFLRLAAGPDGGVSYWGSPGGKAAVPFRLVSLSGREAVFENPAHDYPTRIVYRRSGDTLTATISGADGANAMSWTFRRR